MQNSTVALKAINLDYAVRGQWIWMQTLGCETGFSAGAAGVEESAAGAELLPAAVVLRPTPGLPKRPDEKHTCWMHTYDINITHISGHDNDEEKP